MYTFNLSNKLIWWQRINFRKNVFSMLEQTAKHNQPLMEWDN